jgi:hypothetical protein
MGLVRVVLLAQGPSLAALAGFALDIVASHHGSGASSA